MRHAIRHAMHNIVGAPGRSILTAVVIFIFLTPFMACIAIQAGTQKGLAEARTLIGNEIRLSPDYSAMDANGANTEHFYVKRALADKLLDSEFVTGFTYYLWTLVTADLEPVILGSSNTVVAAAQSKEDPDKNLFQLCGYSRLDLQSDFRKGKFILVSGELPAAKDKNANSSDAVISRDFAETNGLVTGSRFAIESGGSDSGIKPELKVSGIFDKATESSTDTASYYQSVNTIFVPLEAAEGIYKTMEASESEGLLTTALFFLDKPEHFDEFAEELEKRKIDVKGYKLEQEDEEFLQVTGPLRGLETFARVSTLILVFTGAVCMFFMGIAGRKRRRKEIGLFRVIGLSKKQVLLRLAAELVPICLVSFTAAGMAGAWAASPTADMLLKEQTGFARSESQSTARIYIMGDYYKIAEKADAGIDVQLDSKAAGGYGDFIDTIDTAIGFNHVLLFVAAGLLPVLCLFAATARIAARSRPINQIIDLKDR